MRGGLSGAMIWLVILLEGNFGTMEQYHWYSIVLSYLILALWLGFQTSTPCRIEQAGCTIYVSNPVSQATFLSGPQ
ncbi:rCG27097 [Rattus norvegicus]|uniref:RCG27097 n=1 Tax=Rattus norvegicus TaxID=10116 RepID=A6HQ63_RAT|nr:rCG27097 [Rattus norvegicus]